MYLATVCFKLFHVDNDASCLQNPTKNFKLSLFLVFATFNMMLQYFDYFLSVMQCIITLFYYIIVRILS